LLERATTVETALGRKVTWDEAARAYISAFKSVLALELQQGSLTADEIKRTEELVRVKYGHPS
jgi:lipoate-protein ligase A